MILRILFISIFILSPILSYCQNTIEMGTPYAEVELSKKFSVKKDLYYNKESNDIIALKTDGENLYLQKFDASNLTLIKSTKYEDMPAGYVLEEIIKFNKKLYTFYALYDKTINKEQLFCREIDFTTGLFIGKGNLIASIDGKLKGNEGPNGVMKSVIYNKFIFSLSGDRSKILIKYILESALVSDKFNKDVFGVKVLGQELELIWELESQFPYVENELVSCDFSIDNEGNLFLLSKAYIGGKNIFETPKEIDERLEIAIFKVRKSTKDLLKTTFKITDICLNFITFYGGTNNSNLIYIWGGSANLKPNDINKILLFSTDINNVVKQIINYEFSNEIINQYATQKELDISNKKLQKEGDLEIHGLHKLSLEIENDNSILIVCEDIKHGKDNGSIAYKHIFVNKFNNAGSLLWSTKIPKLQYTFVTNHYDQQGKMSFASIDGENNYNFVFMQAKRKEILPDGSAPLYTNFTNPANLICYKLDKNNGKLSKSILSEFPTINETKLISFSVDCIIPDGLDGFILESSKIIGENVLIRFKIK